MEPWFPDVHDATIHVLERAGYTVEVPASQTCCGALAAHDGDTADAVRMAERNAAAFTGFDLVVADAAGCSAHLREYARWAGPAWSTEVADVTRVVAEAIGEGRLPQLPTGRGPVAIQDPCHLRHAQKVVDEPRLIVQAAGYEPVEIDPDGLCCGAAGVYSIERPAAAAELGARKADQIRAAGASIVASANPGCEMQLRAFLDPWFEVRHPVELYSQALREMEG